MSREPATCAPGEAARLVHASVRRAVKAVPDIDTVDLVQDCWRQVARVAAQAGPRGLPRTRVIVAIDTAVTLHADRAWRISQDYC